LAARFFFFGTESNQAFSTILINWPTKPEPTVICRKPFFQIQAGPKNAGNDISIFVEAQVKNGKKLLPDAAWTSVNESKP
jgi:hypothetical protein